MNHLSLFSGIGGIDLAAHWAGFETVAFCEQNKFCQQVLNKHWPEVPIYDDIFTLTAESLVGRGIDPGSINLISGGFPCQPFSLPGKRLGNEDDRALWHQMFRVIKEIRPDWVLGENVAGIISMGIDGVLSDLASEGYTCQPIVLPACAVNAPHRRDRVFIVAHAERKGLEIWQGQTGERTYPAITGGDWWSVEPDVGRMASRVPRRVDRLKALGNAVVPQQVYPILKAIAEWELSK